MISFLLLILLGAVVINLTALFSIPAWRPFRHTEHSFEHALTLALSNAAVLLCACIVMWPLQKLLLIPFRLDYLELPLTMTVIAIIAVLAEQFIARRTNLIPVAHSFRLLMIANGAAAGTVFIDLIRARNLMEYMVLALSAAGVFGLALIAMALMQHRLRLADVPQSFRGPPLMLISIGIATLALMGLVGLVRE
jgi:Na+-translocating ferredoxin:NAD+ oxidoreductase subunit A